VSPRAENRECAAEQLAAQQAFDRQAGQAAGFGAARYIGAAPHVLAQMGVAMRGSLHVYPPRQWQESVSGCYLPAASLVIRKKGVRACVQHGEGGDVLSAARRQVGVHSDDGDVPRALGALAGATAATAA
jgi:hypothetical protein